MADQQTSTDEATRTAFIDELRGMTMTDTATRLRWMFDSLEGLATGDAFGEGSFHNYAEEWVAARKTATGTWHWTDDTALALAICEQLTRGGSVNQEQLAKRFGDRFDPGRRFAPGMRRLLPLLRDGVDWQAASAQLFKGAGSFGSAMRVAPLGAYFADDAERAASEAELFAVITHRHPEGVAGAVAIAVAAVLATAGHQGGRTFVAAVASLTPPWTVPIGDRTESRHLLAVTVAGAGRPRVHPRAWLAGRDQLPAWVAVHGHAE